VGSSIGLKSCYTAEACSTTINTCVEKCRDGRG
jgi:hypothetical protein